MCLMMHGEEVGKFIKGFEDETGIEDFNYKGASLWWIVNNRLKEVSSEIYTDKKKSIFLKKVLQINERFKSIPKKIKKSNSYDLLFFLPKEREIIKDGVISYLRVGTTVNKVKEKKIPYSVELFDKLSKLVSKNPGNLIYNNTTKEINKTAREQANKLHLEWKLIKRRSRDGTDIARKCITYLDFWYSKEILEIIVRYYEICYKLLTENKVRCVVLDSTGHLAERTMIMVANRFNIPCLRLLHGFFPVSAVRKLDFPKNCYVCVYNKDLKKRYIESGMDKNKVFVTGPTFLDLNKIKELKERRKYEVKQS